MLETHSVVNDQTIGLNVQGKALYPGDADYENERQAWNRRFRHNPAVIVVAANSQDVVEAARYARHAGLGVAIQATGHGVTKAADGAMLIVTARMTGVEVDELSQTAWVEAGAKWQHVLDKAHPVGLAPLLGSTPDVGAVGYTLGGGYGWLGRKYGMSTDSVIYFEIVTANGELVQASNVENPDLFRALRGGGVGSFGVVTCMKIKLYPAPTIYGGNLYYDVEDAKEVFTREPSARILTGQSG